MEGDPEKQKVKEGIHEKDALNDEIFDNPVMNNVEQNELNFDSPGSSRNPNANANSAQLATLDSFIRPDMVCYFNIL